MRNTFNLLRDNINILNVLLPESLSRLQKTLLLLAISMVLFSLLRLLFWLNYPETFSQLSAYETLSAFANGLRFDGSVLARFVLLPFVVMVFPWSRLDKRWWFDIS